MVAVTAAARSSRALVVECEQLLGRVDVGRETAGFLEAHPHLEKRFFRVGWQVALRQGQEGEVFGEVLSDRFLATDRVVDQARRAVQLLTCGLVEQHQTLRAEGMATREHPKE